MALSLEFIVGCDGFDEIYKLDNSMLSVLFIFGKLISGKKAFLLERLELLSSSSPPLSLSCRISSSRGLCASLLCADFVEELLGTFTTMLVLI